MKALKVVGVSIALLVVLIGVLWMTGLGAQAGFWAFAYFNKPAGEFDPALTAPAPDYSLEENWASLPEKSDPADLVPDGVEVLGQGEHPVDVFFVHPTGFLTSGSWTSPMDPNSGTEQNTEWMLANQASAYNGCCNVYAPRYREANIFSYFLGEEVRDEVLAFAYEDVKRAFEYYLEHHNNGKPFVLASHSQGTHHSMRLLSDVIDTSDLHERMVAAYIIGAVLIPLSPDWFATMDHINPCATENDLHCVVHWDAMPEGVDPIERPAPSLCTNPYSWRVDEEVADKSMGDGVVAPEGTYHLVLGHEPDLRTDDPFEALDSPTPPISDAQCRDGSLFVSPQSEGPLAAMGEAMPDSYHGLDYALFYMDIHNNAKLRVSKFLANSE